MVSEPGSSEPELSFRKSTALISAQTKPLKTLPAKGGWRGVMNLKPKLLVQELITSGYKKDEAKRSRRGSNLLRSMMKDEEAMSKAASTVEVIGEWLKHPHVAQATRWRLYKKKKQPRLSLGDFTLFPSSRFCPKGFSLVRFLMRKFFKVPKLDLGSARVKLEGECFGRVLRLQKWSDECAKIGLSPGGT
ncbi:hypothetical protein YC2023_045243 [Brassica napus]